MTEPHSEKSTADVTESPDQPLQFSIHAVLELTLLTAIGLAVASTYPQECRAALRIVCSVRGWTVVGIILGTVLSSLFVIWAVLQLGTRLDRVRSRLTPFTRARIPAFHLFVLRLLGFSHSQDSLSLRDTGPTTAIVIASTILMWPLIRETSIVANLSTIWGVSQTWDWAIEHLPGHIGRIDFWVRLWKWESYSIARWIILFGSITILWTLIAAPFQHPKLMEAVHSRLLRLTQWAPWLMILEVSYLCGVWVNGSTTVPEPSTGFVVGIFDWSLWHWDCWRDQRWLQRGGLPTVAIGYLYFRCVLCWWRVPAAMGAIWLIPVAIWLSIVTTVTFQNGLP